MTLEEYNKVKNYTYAQYCQYLIKKYGPVKYKYFTSGWNRQTKNSRVWEGLYCHHIAENISSCLCDPWKAQSMPIEYQFAENLCYANLLEHMLLHILIAEEDTTIDPNDLVGIDGIMCFMIPELNDTFAGIKYSEGWQNRCHLEVANCFETYKALVKRLKPLYIYKYEELLCVSWEVATHKSKGCWSKKDKQACQKIYEIF